ncbi:MAG: CAP domain-containing protein [Roseibium sp.]|nr:CAP domain-containing protein [Roseibium sp.]
MIADLRAVCRFVAIGAVCSVLAGCLADGDGKPAFYQDMARVDAQVDAAVAAQMISQYRVNNGLSPVVADKRLTALAADQARVMARAKTVNASLAGEQNLDRRLAGIGEDGVPAAENVSAGYRTLAEAFSGWRESANHNAVMLHPDASRLGIATAYASGSKHKVFWSLILAGPAPSP